MVLKFFLLASVFFFASCVSVDRSNPDDPDGDNYQGENSSSARVPSSSSSSVSVKNYCVYAELKQCYFGIYSTCPGVGGELADTCPYGSSSSAVVSGVSSQSGKSSSSEALPEYGYCVFISEKMCLSGPLTNCPPGGTLSNSCPYESSSSAAVPSSSSTKQSSNSNSVPSSSSSSKSSSSSAPTSSSSSLAQSSSSSTVMVSSSSVATPATPSSSSVALSSSSAVVSSSSSMPSSSSSSIQANVIIYGDPVDYEGETYKTVVIGTQTWFQRNLNYEVEGSICYDNSEANCEKYGRLYDWATAMNLPDCNSKPCSSQIGTKHKGICPDGWHIPNDAEWTTLTDFVGSPQAGTKLKATSGWNYNGTDIYGFAALPGGKASSDGIFNHISSYGYWWSATEYLNNYVYYRQMYSSSALVKRETEFKRPPNLLSIRCVQD